MTRLTFKDTGTLLVTNRAIFVDGHSVVVVLDPSTYTGMVNTHAGETLATFTADNLAALKKVAKVQLMNMGVPFTQEVRQRGATERIDAEGLTIRAS